MSIKINGHNVIVRYHVDRCTKNKRMIRIPTRGMFLTCPESPFFILCMHNIKLRAGAYCLKEINKIPLIGKAVPYSWCRNPILSGPLLAVNCLYAPCPPSPSAPASHQKTHTDDINMPAASVRHSNIRSHMLGKDYTIISLAGESKLLTLSI
jgi:hypothetical protein